MCLVNDNEQFDAVKQFVFLEVVILIVMVMMLTSSILIADIYIFGKYGNFLTSEIYNTR